MKFLNLQVSETGGEEPHDILGFPDPDHRRPGFLAQPTGKLKGGEEPGGLGGPDAGRALELRGGTGGQPAEGAIGDLKKACREFKRSLAARPGAQDNGEKLDSGQRPGAQRPEPFTGTI